VPSDESATYVCPEPDCGLRLDAEALHSHLRWDHNRSDYEADETLRELRADDDRPDSQDGDAA
jgi:hypothetical protein